MFFGRKKELVKRKGEIGEEVERDVANAYFDALVDVASLMGCETR